MKYLSEAITNHFGVMEGLDTWNGVVTRWPYAEPQPSPEELEALRLAYELSIDAEKEKPAIEEAIALLLKLSNPVEQDDIKARDDLTARIENAIS